MKHVVPHAVAKHPQRAATARQEARPPPVVVLRAQLAVRRDDGHFADRHEEDGGHGAEEPKHVVVAAFVLPEVREDEEELDEEHREGRDAREDDALCAAGVPGLRGDLARDRGCFGGVLPCGGADEAVPAAGVDQWDLDEEPEHD